MLPELDNFMNTSVPFGDLPLKKPNIFQRLFGWKPKINAINEINNLLAVTPQLKDVTIEQVQTIADKYKVNLTKKFPENLQRFYKDYLAYCIQDKLLSDDEISNLAHLKNIICLNDKDVNTIHNETAGEVYKKQFDDVLLDGSLSPEEKGFLEKLKNDLKLPDETARNIYALQGQNYFEKVLCSKLTDERLSPNEEKELDDLAKNLGANINYEPKMKSVLDRYRLFWIIENSDVPEIKVPINLQRKEKCYYACDIEWLENRKVTRRIQYGGPTVRIKICKGVYWRAGDLAVNRISEDVLMPIDSGRVYLTSKRLIFMGARKNTTIGLSKVLDFTPYKNGVEIEKETGKSPFLKFDNDIKVFSMILGRAIKDLD